MEDKTTSREALCYLDDIAHGRKMEYDPHELKCIVEKDLEVLEIIKKKNVATFLIPCCNNARDYSMKTSGFEALTDKEFKLLKEWLENE